MERSRRGSWGGRKRLRRESSQGFGASRSGLTWNGFLPSTSTSAPCQSHNGPPPGRACTALSTTQRTRDTHTRTHTHIHRNTRFLFRFPPSICCPRMLSGMQPALAATPTRTHASIVDCPSSPAHTHAGLHTRNNAHPPFNLPGNLQHEQQQAAARARQASLAARPPGRPRRNPSWTSPPCGNHAGTLG